MTTATQEWLGWHWLQEDGCLAHAPYTKVEVGQTLTVKEPIKLCKRGFHASKRAIDALQYAPGPIICRVSLSGKILEEKDKAVATQRTVIAMADATNVLHEFACWCAEEALTREREAGRKPDARSWQAIEVKRRWLRGEASDEELAAAREAAWEAASAAASAAAREAAWEAASAAASAAAREAASAADWEAAREAAWEAQNTKLTLELCNLLQVAIPAEVHHA